MHLPSDLPNGGLMRAMSIALKGHRPTIVTPSKPLTLVERMFMEAGHSRISYGIWRSLTLPSLKINATVSSLFSGWRTENLDDEATELKLAKRWLEEQALKLTEGHAETDRSTADTPPVPLGPLMTTSEVLGVLRQEIQDGHPITTEAFESALRRTANKARRNPEQLPLSLGGQHANWWLVELGPKKGGHGGGHKLRRRLN